MASSREAERQKLLELSAEANSLTQQLADYSRFDNLPAELRSEMTALFPQVRTLSLARTTEASRDTTAVCQYVMALIRTDDGTSLTDFDASRLVGWLKARTDVDSLVVVCLN